jgi:hypothetical protein
MSMEFKTDNFYLGVFLSSKGLTLTGIDRSNPRRCKFIFVDSPQREKLVEVFNFGKPGCRELKVDARNLITAIRQLKAQLYQE